jgi:hypothetical protein
MTIKPTRVVTRVEDGCVAYAEPADSAARKGIYPDVVYVRNDGWSLGARFADEGACARSWQGEWSARIVVATGEMTVLSA